MNIFIDQRTGDLYEVYDGKPGITRIPVTRETTAYTSTDDGIIWGEQVTESRSARLLRWASRLLFHKR